MEKNFFTIIAVLLCDVLVFESDRLHKQWKSLMSLKNHPRRRGDAYVSTMSSPPFLFLNGHIPELSVQPERNTCQQKLREGAEILVATEELDACSIASLSVAALLTVIVAFYREMP
jgi:hypothetical protein